jgi:hypothetical protein
VFTLSIFIINNVAFFTLFDEPGKDERSLLNYFSMCISSCSKLHKAVQDPFQKTGTKHGAISYCPGRGAVALRYVFEIHGCVAVKGNQHNPFKSLYCQCTYVRGGANKSLDRPGRKQATATKLGIYSTHPPTKLKTLLSPLP